MTVIQDPHELEIPEGVRKYVLAPPDGNDTFGLKCMRYRQLDDFEGGKVQGIVLIFYPLHIRASVERVELSAEEINEIGVLLRQLVLNRRLCEFILNTGKVCEQTNTELAAILSSSGLYTDDIGKTTSEILSKTGVLVDDLKLAKAENQQEFASIVARLHELKVNLVNALLSQASWPIKKMAKSHQEGL